MDDRFELGVRQGGESLRLEHRTIAGRGRQHGCHGNRLHQLVRVGPCAVNFDACRPPGCVMSGRIARWQRGCADRIVDRTGTSIGRYAVGDNQRAFLDAAEDRRRRWFGGGARSKGDDGRRWRLRLGHGKTRRDASDQRRGFLNRLGGQAFRWPCPAFVEYDQADRDAGAMLGIGVAEDRDLDTRVRGLADHRIAGGRCTVRCEAGWHDRDAAAARCQPEQRGTQMTGAGEAVLAPTVAPAEGRVHQHEARGNAGG